MTEGERERKREREKERENEREKERKKERKKERGKFEKEMEKEFLSTLEIVFFTLFSAMARKFSFGRTVFQSNVKLLSFAKLMESHFF